MTIDGKSDATSPGEHLLRALAALRRARELAYEAEDAERLLEAASLAAAAAEHARLAAEALWDRAGRCS